VQIILTHNRADFDGIAAMLAAYKLYPDSVPVLPKLLSSNVAEFVMLYQNGLPFVHWDDFKPDNRIARAILVDTQRMPGVRGIRPDLPTTVFDHHTPDDDLPEHMTYIGEELGAITTLLVEQIRGRGDIALTSLEATLLALGIYADTGSLTYGGTTARDLVAAAWLMERGVALDKVRRFLSNPLGDLQQDLLDHLMRNSTTRNIQGFTMTVCAVAFGQHVDHVNSVTQRLRDMLDPDVIFVAVGMPSSVQLVARARIDALDVGQVAAYFGGGGHPRAAAANVDGELEAIVAELWHQLEQRTQPVTRVADLMSFGVQTVDGDDTIGTVITNLRKIGHEGYPVLDEDGTVIGLLTRRDADRAFEHGLHKSKIRDVMISDGVTLTPDDSVHALEQLMVESGWGQIPVVAVDDAQNVMGIVTRTDLIKHWAQVHPSMQPPQARIDRAHMRQVLGDDVSGLIEAIADHVRRSDTHMYMVGGVVRDLLLERPNYDIDFVLEADAIKVAQELAAIYGGEISSFRPFGTAKWNLDRERVAHDLHLQVDDLPDHIDFATSRNEFYDHPTALPSVYNSSIKLDLQRRDFTMNTLAVQLSPRGLDYRLLDYYGGVDDLQSGTIRVLHSLSFVDDPTRALRAVRFEQRLGFHIEPRTAELIKTAHPMLRRITGERLRNELTLLLKENTPENGLLVMQERGILPAIHLAFHFSPTVANQFAEARETVDQWPVAVDKMTGLYWHLIMAHIQPEGIDELCERLLFSKAKTDSFLKTAHIVQHTTALADPQAAVSTITDALEGATETALITAWVLGNALQRERIIDYMNIWRHIRPVTTGHTLQQKNLPPGPEYGMILSRLRAARLDGEVNTDAEEADYLETLIEDVYRDRT